MTQHKVSAYIVRVLGGMAHGLFASLIIGLIIKQIGHYTTFLLLEQIGMVTQYLTGPAIGVGVAIAVGAPPLGIICSAVTGAIGGGTFVMGDGTAIVRMALGEPVGAMLAGLAAAEAAKKVVGKTGVDIIVVPLTAILFGSFVGHFIAPPIAALMTYLGNFITLPISSAAICISLGLSGLAAGAAVVGCSCQMVGFAVSSYKENKLGGLISQGIGTSMLQIPNIVKNPLIWIPPTLTAAILGPVSTVVFKMENNSSGAGMGTSGLVGQFNAIAVMGAQAWPQILLMHIALPALLSLMFSQAMRKKGWIKDGDMLLVK
jgi:uncharacterized membrane protein